MADIATSAGAPQAGGEGLRSNVRVVAHDHRTHDAPIQAPDGFEAIPVRFPAAFSATFPVAKALRFLVTFSASISVIMVALSVLFWPLSEPHVRVQVESMLRMAYDIKTGTWNEDKVDIKVEGE